jgi:hypothetical protein
VRKEGVLESEQGLGWEDQELSARLSLIPQQVLDKSSASLQELEAASFDFLQP